MDSKKLNRSKAKRSGKKKHAFNAYNYSRLKGVQAVKPILYGNLSWKLQQQNDCHTHQWITYVRGYNDEDISAFVKFVQFKLHVSYDNPIRVCHYPPYQVTETGWGEFEIVIRICFKDPTEKPVTLYHYLKLIAKENAEKPVIAEFYDELIFTDPTLVLYDLLRFKDSTIPCTTLGWIDHEQKKSEFLHKILNAKEKLKEEISSLKIKLAEAKAILEVRKSEMRA